MKAHNAIFVWVLMLVNLCCVYAQYTYKVSGPYAVAMSGGWTQAEDAASDYFIFSNGKYTVSLIQNPFEAEGGQALSKHVQNYTQALKSTNEFVEGSKPSLLVNLLGKTNAYRLIVKSKISGERKWVYFISTGNFIYELNIEGPASFNEMNNEALAFAELIYINGDKASQQMALANAKKLKIQIATFPESQPDNEGLENLKKVKVYGNEKSGKDPSGNASGDNEVEAKVQGAVFTASASNLSGGEKLSIQEEESDISFFETYFDETGYKQIADNFKLLRLYEIGPEGKKFDSPGKIEVAIPKNELPSGKNYDDLLAVMVSDNKVEMIPFEITDNGIKVKVEHCSYMAIPILILGGVATIIFGTALANVKKGSDPVFKKKCADWTDIENEKNAPLKEILKDPSKFKIGKDGTLSLDVGKPLKGKGIGMGNHLLKPGEFINKPEGDCVNFSNLFGCLLKAKRYEVRVVAGKATYPSESGGHQWVEVIYNGKPHYLDTYNPSSAKLIPLDEATKQFKLQPGTMCTDKGPVSYDKNWFRGMITDKDAMLSRYNALREEHKVLNEACISGNNAACDERRAVYLEAMDLRKKLEAMGVKVVE